MSVSGTFRITAEALGGRRTLGRTIVTRRGLMDAVRAGLPYPSLDSLVGLLGVSRQQLLRWLALPERTIARRSSGQRLRPDESDRLMRVARLLALGGTIFGSTESAAAWMRTPNRALGGEIPLSLLDTDLGCREVEDALGKMEHGVFS